MSDVALVTGASGLIGSQTARFLHEKGMKIIGIDNNMRSYFFGVDGSTDWNATALQEELEQYSHIALDVRDLESLGELFGRYGTSIKLVVHCAAQPSHGWAAREPHTDFTVNALATLNVLECTRRHCPKATLIFTSSILVYGDTPSSLPVVEKPMRWECDEEHAYGEHGIDEHMSIDQSKHSLFGASKLVADVMCQEYGRYFGLNVGIFRGGCLTGPAHSGVELHGFLAYLVKCHLTGRPYTVYGYKGKQVRDNIHSYDLVNAFWHFHQAPRPGEVYNIGGGRHSNCSVLEAIQLIEKLSGRHLDYTIVDEARPGDPIWWISDVRKFQSHYPDWNYKYDIESILKEVITATAEREGLQP